jgi:hypothetical protein
VLRTWDVTLTAHLLYTRWWPWGLMAGFSAIATAYNIDNEERPGLRWREAALQAAVGVFGALIVYLRLTEVCGPEAGCVPSLLRMLLAALASGGVIGWLVPTWCREPQTLTVDYKGWHVIVTVHTLPNGQITPAIQVVRPSERSPRHRADASASALPFEREFASAEEALAKGVEHARKHIDGYEEVPGPTHVSAA